MQDQDGQNNNIIIYIVIIGNERLIYGVIDTNFKLNYKNIFPSQYFRSTYTLTKKRLIHNKHPVNITWKVYKNNITQTKKIKYNISYMFIHNATLSNLGYKMHYTCLLIISIIKQCYLWMVFIIWHLCKICLHSEYIIHKPLY